MGWFRLIKHQQCQIYIILVFTYHEQPNHDVLIDSNIRHVNFVIPCYILQFVYCSLADMFEDDNCFTSGKDDLDFAR